MDDYGLSRCDSLVVEAALYQLRQHIRGHVASHPRRHEPSEAYPSEYAFCCEVLVIEDPVVDDFARVLEVLAEAGRRVRNDCSDVRVEATLTPFIWKVVWRFRRDSKKTGGPR